MERKKSGAPFAMRITVRTYIFEINGCYVDELEKANAKAKKSFIALMRHPTNIYPDTLKRVILETWSCCAGTGKGKWILLPSILRSHVVP